MTAPDDLTVTVGCDHAGLEHRDLIIAHLASKGLKTLDLGAPRGVERADYPVVAKAVAKAILSGQAGLGVLICGTGVGMSLVANRFKGIRAANCFNEFMAAMARAHNDANILTLGQRTIGPGLALSILDTFLATSFEGGRHRHRLDLFDRSLGDDGT
jgi:ribose 5-phosphate isomerase B